MENEIKEVRSFCLGGKENLVKIIIYRRDRENSKSSFSFKLQFSNGNFLVWEDCSKDCGGFKYCSKEDAVDAALDFLVNHASFYNLMRHDYEENPENNVEEIPEDFRLDMKK